MYVAIPLAAQLRSPFEGSEKTPADIYALVELLRRLPPTLDGTKPRHPAWILLHPL